MQPVLEIATVWGPQGGGVTWHYVAVFFGAVHSRVKWPKRPQLKHMWPEMALAVGGAGKRITSGGEGRALGTACWCWR
jgi:hypothetical protein